jgi:hypothetical protein
MEQSYASLQRGPGGARSDTRTSLKSGEAIPGAPIPEWLQQSHSPGVGANPWVGLPGEAAAIAPFILPSRNKEASLHQTTTALNQLGLKPLRGS